MYVISAKPMVYALMKIDMKNPQIFETWAIIVTKGYQTLNVRLNISAEYIIEEESEVKVALCL